jgi:predicted transcriptional regulator
MFPLDRVLKHQYHATNYRRYLELIQDLLQAEKHDELTMTNHHQCPIGMALLPEANYISKGKENVDGNKSPKYAGKCKKGKRNKYNKNKFKDQTSGKAKKSFKCHHCGGPNHITKKCNIPQHLVDLYQKSLKEAGKVKGLYEAHFNATSNEATTLSKRPIEAAKPSLIVEDYIDRENMIIEYNPNDVFGDQD